MITSDEVFDALDTLVAEGVIAGATASAWRRSTRRSPRSPGRAWPPCRSSSTRSGSSRWSGCCPPRAAAGVGIIARVPLASGLLSGRYSETTTFAADDHRTYNRHGEAFDVGETFSGVDYDDGVRAAREFAALAASRDLSPARAALAWVAQLDGVTTVIPGARSAEQARDNAAAGSVPPLGAEFNDGRHRAVRPAPARLDPRPLVSR